MSTTVTHTMTPEEIADWEAKLAAGRLFVTASRPNLLCKVCARDTGSSQRYCAEHRHLRPSRAQHGTLSKYRMGCRCAPCTAADRAYSRAYRQRRKSGDSGLPRSNESSLEGMEVV